MRLWMRVYTVTLPLALCVLIICNVRLLSVSHRDTVNREYGRALGDHAMLVAALSTHMNAISNQFENNPELRQQAISAAVQNYARYYTGSDVALQILDARETILYSGMTSEQNAILALSPSRNGGGDYVIRQSDGHTLLFVSGWLNIVGGAFRIDYMRDISSIAEDMRSFAWETSFFLFGAVVVLGVGLYFMISAAMRPLSTLTRQALALAQGNYAGRIPPAKGETGELAQAFNDMAGAIEERIRQLESAAESRDIFIANLAHEIKTPVTTILGYADLLRRARLSPEQTTRALESIHEVGARLDALSQKLLNLFLIQGGGALTLCDEDISALFSRVKTALSLHLSQRNITLQTECHLETWPLDAELFDLVLVNLVENAIKASKAGDIITLSAQKSERGAVFSIADQGYGIPESELSRVRQPFYMVDKARARKQNGAGLGLTLCEAIARAHNATLHIESREGVGTTVKIIF